MSIWEMFQFWFIKGFAEIVSGIALMIVIVIIAVMVVGTGYVKARWRAWRDLKKKVVPQIEDVWIDEDDNEFRVLEIKAGRGDLWIEERGLYGAARWWETEATFTKRRREQGLHLRYRSLT